MKRRAYCSNIGPTRYDCDCGLVTPAEPGPIATYRMAATTQSGRQKANNEVPAAPLAAGVHLENILPEWSEITRTLAKPRLAAHGQLSTYA